VLLSGFATAANDSRPAQPNVILLLTDDLGWQDVKCYDIDEPSPMETPNIDALAKEGVLFWQAYSPGSDVCPESLCDHEW
jgi:arylsulfatase A-like enzyme